MITENLITWQSRLPTWQQSLQNAVRDPQELLTLLELPPNLLQDTVWENPRFHLRVPRGYVARMQKGNIHDPLLRQVLPLQAEQLPFANFTTDPVGDNAASKGSGLLHKYQGRVLIIVTAACAIHCRYCFRQHYDYRENNSSELQNIYNYIQADNSIHEVILSGGDPLSVKDSRLVELINLLASIPHLQRLRIHSRLPIVLPERVTPELITALTQTRLQTIMVVHANHAAELDNSVAQALQKLANAGITLFNQAVLLRGVNADVESLVQLHERLFEQRVVPYYLHLLDRVQGAGHFEVSETAALSLIETMRERLSGYLVPRLVREVTGLGYKSPVF
ncbi:MAG: beta-lysylation protein EpmB [Pseudomonadota bacterium]|jgi:EF-P beta-lysylation protein EpmB